MAKSSPAGSAVRRSTAAAEVRSRTRPVRLLITGFGPFPGAPDNPTGPLVRVLARRLKAHQDLRVATHVFRTTYAAADRALPRLLKKHKPDAVLMFGLAASARGIRIETQARNRISHHPDAGGFTPGPCPIDATGPRGLPVKAPATALLRAAATSGLPARLSRDAGQYLCNYVLWHATRAVKSPVGPKLAAFIHVPLPSARFTMEGLAAAGEAIALAAAKRLRGR